jgi:hypothetical protein
MFLCPIAVAEKFDINKFFEEDRRPPAWQLPSPHYLDSDATGLPAGTLTMKNVRCGYNGGIHFKLVNSAKERTKWPLYLFVRMRDSDGDWMEWAKKDISIGAERSKYLSIGYHCARATSLQMRTSNNPFAY